MSNKKLSKILRTALPSSKVEWRDSELVNGGASVTKSAFNLKMTIELLWNQDGGACVYARILDKHNYVFQEFGEVLKFSADDILNEPESSCAYRIKYAVTPLIDSLSVQLSMLSAAFA